MCERFQDRLLNYVFSYLIARRDIRDKSVQIRKALSDRVSEILLLSRQYGSGIHRSRLVLLHAVIH
jgi:hypothetical protein